mmetsp:Transcript_9178/g.20294  ORF Transcript_9178/g.20294 Transcript_9178/m.20294 type:complete len:350 (+) Transcript_9178:49-1098(+)
MHADGRVASIARGTGLSLGGIAVGVWLWRAWRRSKPCLFVEPESLRSGDEEHRLWAKKLTAFIFDIDGVVHTGSGPIEGAAQAIQSIRDAGKRLIFVTNNATKSQQDIVNTFSRYDISVQPDEILTSCIAVANYLRSRGLQGHRVYVVGMVALCDVLRDRVGMFPFGAEDDSEKKREDCLVDFLPRMIPPASEVAAVVVGADFTFNYYKVMRAANYLRQNHSCLLVGTNPDPVALLGPRTFSPAAGSMLQCIATAAGREPDMVCGKPSAAFAREVVVDFGLDPTTTCMVGDRTDTDIEFGHNAGMQTLFVCSGTMTEEDARGTEELTPSGRSRRPHFIAPSIATLRHIF